MEISKFPTPALILDEALAQREPAHRNGAAKEIGIIKVVRTTNPTVLRRLHIVLQNENGCFGVVLRNLWRSRRTAGEAGIEDVMVANALVTAARKIKRAAELSPKNEIFCVCC